MPSSVLSPEFMKTSIRLAAFILATLPLVASVLLAARAIF
jgi:hypothetical protein